MGKQNSGDHNSGDYNSGNWNSGDRNSGFFNSNEPTVRMFNKDTGLYRKDIKMPYIDLKLNVWVNDDENYPTTRGYLKTYSYKEAWSNFWNSTTEELKQQIQELPNFNAEIFKEITGIDVNNKKKYELVFEGKKVEISKESAIALGLIKE